MCEHHVLIDAVNSVFQNFKDGQIFVNGTVY